MASVAVDRWGFEPRHNTEGARRSRIVITAGGTVWTASPRLEALSSECTATRIGERTRPLPSITRARDRFRQRGEGRSHLGPRCLSEIPAGPRVELNDCRRSRRGRQAGSRRAIRRFDHLAIRRSARAKPDRRSPRWASTDTVTERRTSENRITTFDLALVCRMPASMSPRLNESARRSRASRWSPRPRWIMRPV